jgi:type VI secretion system protein VasJ
LAASRRAIRLESSSSLGPAYQDARTAVIGETAAFLARLPGMQKLSFKDDTPFASPMTLEWLETTVAPIFGSGGGGGAPGPGESSHLTDQFGQARQKLGSGDLAGALKVMQAGRGEDTSQADRFRRRLYEAMLCLRGGQPMLARPMLESLDATVEKYGLPSWDPALTLEVWSNLYQCFNALAKDAKAPDKPALLEQASGVLGKIAGLDPSHALTVQVGS